MSNKTVDINKVVDQCEEEEEDALVGENIQTARFDEEKCGGAAVTNNANDYNSPLSPQQHFEVMRTLSPKAAIIPSVSEDLNKVFTTEVTNEVINRLLCEIEVLYFDHFDEISD